MLAALLLLAPLVPPPPPPPSTLIGREIDEKDSAARVARPTNVWIGEEPAKHGAKALALCGDRLVATTLSVKLDPDFPYDKDDPADRGRNTVGVAACKDAVFFVVGDVGLKAGAVTRSAGFHNALGRVDLKGGGSLRREGNADSYVVLLDTVVRRQILLEARGTDDASVDAIFVGDLNGDGFDDVVLDASWHYNLSTLRLFLSDASGTLREVAHHSTTGC